VTWSKRQDVVSRSNAEAKYRVLKAIAHTTCEMVWLKKNSTNGTWFQTI